MSEPEAVVDQAKTLTPEQISSFYHTDFFNGQVASFKELIKPEIFQGRKVVVDIGGGLGYFAQALQEQIKFPVRVLDTDPVSVEECQRKGLEACCEDALKAKPKGDEAVVCFNMILHHLVGDTEESTRALQMKALTLWRDANIKIFVNEYIYESYIPGLSGRLIYEITKNKLLSTLGLAIAKFAPSMRANTFGVGVRFRSHDEWRNLFTDAGFRISGIILGDDETISIPRRGLLIKSIRKDSFLLEPV